MLPKDKNQAYYLKKKNNMVQDPVYNITSTMKEYQENGEERFIRSYTLDDGSPKVVAFLDSQVEDIANFCCNDINGCKSLLYCDLTFQLGPFYLLLTAYNNTLLHYKDTDHCPVMIGPMMLCMMKDEPTYLSLIHTYEADADASVVSMRRTINFVD